MQVSTRGATGVLRLNSISVELQIRLARRNTAQKSAKAERRGIMTQHKQTMESIAYTSFCSAFNLKPEWLGKTFKDQKGRSFTITGLNIRSRRFPVLTKEGIRFNADYLRGLMTGDAKLFERAQREKHNEKLKRARKDYKGNCFLYGLDPSWLDKTFLHRGTTYRIDGVRLGARRFNVLCRKENNDATYFNPEYVTKLMNEQYPRDRKA